VQIGLSIDPVEAPRLLTQTAIAALNPRNDRGRSRVRAGMPIGLTDRFDTNGSGV